MTDYFGNGNVLTATALRTDVDEIDEGEVDYHLKWMRAKAEARRRFDTESRQEIDLPPVRNLTELLAEPDTETPYLIEGLAPAGSRVILAAQAKSGKTVLTGNLVRSLVDMDPFLGRFAIRRRVDRVVVIDTELSENMVRRWFRDQGIVNTDRVDVAALRGRVGTFNILDEQCRADWANLLRGADYMVLDCLRPILDSLGLDENRDAGKFLVAFDALMAEAGISDALLVHHMGHSGERVRGDSRLQDWPDAHWRIVRATADDPDAHRFFTAYGRDVDLPEGRLVFIPENRRLTYNDGTRKAVTRQADHEEVLSEIVDVLAQRLGEGNTEPMTRNAIIDALKDNHRTARTVDPALALGVEKPVLTKGNGPRGSHLYTLTKP